MKKVSISISGEKVSLGHDVRLCGQCRKSFASRIWKTSDRPLDVLVLTETEVRVLNKFIKSGGR
jgi:hypothetical protein